MFSPFTLEQAADALKQGKVIAYPTEAVFGLGCDPNNEKALIALLEVKQRAKNKGMILIASSIAQVLPYIELSQVPKDRWEQIQQYWPGPYTFVFPVSQQVHALVKGQYETVAVRVTAHPVACALCEVFGGALVSTSANISNDEPCRYGQSVFEIFGTSIAGVVEGEVGGALKPTSIQSAVTGEIYR
ncbi:MAG: threonylcarbamoyl-AMP synthase [Gammaproteobacteria bacterium]|jgi:L-threonylcarbamoyladenylate synthase|nr:threonylcarbamoyl-AMP synthase [Gammaproteobacteria bacterium]